MEQVSEDSESLMAHPFSIKKMKDETVEPDPFNLPCHKFKKNIQTKLQYLLKECQSQFILD